MKRQRSISLSKLPLLALIASHILAVTPSYAAKSSKSTTSKPGKIKRLSQVKVIKKENNLYTNDNLKGKFSNWGLNPFHKGSINLKKAWDQFEKNKDVNVAVVDTGIDFNHPHFNNQNHITLEGQVGPNNFGKDFSKPKGSKPWVTTNRPTDEHGHGTHVAGIVKSAAPEAKLLTLKYYSVFASGAENLKATIDALRYAVDKNVDIINYSGGGPEPSVEELTILKEAERKGILVVAAAGNEKSDIDHKANAYYPASYGLSNIITVMAHNQMIEKIGSSNFGKTSVDISAPGYRIKSAIPGSPVQNVGLAGYMTGTSQATAFVSGVAALVKSKYPKMSASTIRTIIIASANTTFNNIKQYNRSGGILDANAALKLADKVAKGKKLYLRKIATLKREISSTAPVRFKLKKPRKK